MMRGWIVLIALLGVGCELHTEGVGALHPLDSSSRVRAAPTTASRPDDTLSSARVPHDEGRFYPSLARLAEPEANIERLARTSDCVECHREAVRQHASSAHARSSFDNPWYRASVDQLRAEHGNRASRHCAGCHDPLLLFSGRIDSEIDPSDPETASLASAGITCLVCHGVVETTTDGNASYVLSTAPVPIPDPNNEAQIAAHRARLAPPPLRTPGLCGSCHRAFLGPQMGAPHHLPGLDELGPWRGSAWGEQQAQRLDSTRPTETQARCRGCHMPEQPIGEIELGAPDGLFASHRFAGGHSALAARLGDEEQLRAIEAQQRSAVTIDIASLVRESSGERFLPSDGAPVEAGETVHFDVVLRNTRAGHFFPGGAKDLRDHWVSVRVRDGSGHLLAEAGTDHVESEDPSAFILRSAMLDPEGTIEANHFVHRFAARGWDHTIAPRDARAVRYRWTIPPDAQLPLRIEATLNARRHHAQIRELGCRATRSPRGRAFASALSRLDISVIDGCAPEPVFELATTTVRLGETDGPSHRPTWLRLYEHAMALLHDVQERLEEARFSIEAGIRALDPEDPDLVFRRNQFLLLLAQLESSQGRHEEAIALCERIEEAIGPHPAIERVRGNSAARVWRWELAAAAFDRVRSAAPLDTQAHRDRARAWGSVGNDGRALAAATEGLRLLPRDEALLRTQALALRHLEHADADSAQRAFIRYRVPDNETSLRYRCERSHPNCQRDRLPIPTIALH